MWAFGCLVYEMLHGVPAYTGGSIDQIFTRIRQVHHTPYHADLGAQPKALLQALFVKDHAKRLSAEEVMQHTWIVAAQGYVAYQRKPALDKRGASTHPTAQGGAVPPPPSPPHGEAHAPHLVKNEMKPALDNRVSAKGSRKTGNSPPKERVSAASTGVAPQAPPPAQPPSQTPPPPPAQSGSMFSMPKWGAK